MKKSVFWDLKTIIFCLVGWKSPSEAFCFRLFLFDGVIHIFVKKKTKKRQRLFSQNMSVFLRFLERILQKEENQGKKDQDKEPWRKKTLSLTRATQK